MANCNWFSATTRRALACWPLTNTLVMLAGGTLGGKITEALITVPRGPTLSIMVTVLPVTVAEPQMPVIKGCEGGG